MKRLVYLSPVALNSPSQRPHHFVEWANACLGCEIFWVEPYPVRLPRLSDLHRLKPKTQGADLAPNWRNASWLKVLSPPSLPLEPLPGGAALIGWMQHTLRQRLSTLLKDSDTWLVVGRPSGMALALCESQQGQRVLYDVMDDMAQFSQGASRRWMEHAHHNLLKQAELVWGSSARIIHALKGCTRRPSVLVRNGTFLPPESFSPNTTGVGSATHAQATLILGYVGTLASWFDWQVLRQIATALPRAKIHVYGPLEASPPPSLPPNVQLLGVVAHARIFELMQSWHAGLIPFQQTPLTASVDPVKYYEYRACGLPVLSTMFGEMPHHAANDVGVWPLESLEAFKPGELEARLRHWHEAQAVQHAQGQPLTPASLQHATWPARFEAGAILAGWLQPS